MNKWSTYFNLKSLWVKDPGQAVDINDVSRWYLIFIKWIILYPELHCHWLRLKRIFGSSSFCPWMWPARQPERAFDIRHIWRGPGLATALFFLFYFSSIKTSVDHRLYLAFTWRASRKEIQKKIAFLTRPKAGLMVGLAQSRDHLALHELRAFGALGAKVWLVACCAVIVLVSGKETWGQKWELDTRTWIH